MVVVIFLFFAWFAIHAFVSIPVKLPLIVNLQLFMAIEIVLTNKLTIIGFNLGLFRIHTESTLRFIALIVHNDLTVTFILLTFANLCLTDESLVMRWGAWIGAFLFQSFVGAMLRWMHVLTDRSWNVWLESLTILLLLVYTWAMAKLFKRMAHREGWFR